MTSINTGLLVFLLLFCPDQWDFTVITYIGFAHKLFHSSDYTRSDGLQERETEIYMLVVIWRGWSCCYSFLLQGTASCIVPFKFMGIGIINIFIFPVSSFEKSRMSLVNVSSVSAEA
ncbi:hypothetical protein MAP00_001013 [Monascus purpureus]|nr:hypothetical protein MAP00_001013 [Monascus purpureus]